MPPNPPNEDAWDPWSPEQITDKLRDLNVPWYVVGGWAIDLYLGKSTRSHSDLEIAMSPVDFPKCAQHLPALTFYAAIKGTLTHWPPNTPIAEHIWQIWGLDLQSERWKIDIMMERGTLTHWIYKRDPAIAQPRAHALRKTPQGIPYLAPANVLLFKAKACRAKDFTDFKAVLPSLSDEERRFLRCWLEAQHPNHAWISQLM